MCITSDPCKGQANSFCKFNDTTGTYSCECNDGFWKITQNGNCESTFFFATLKCIFKTLPKMVWLIDSVAY